MKKLLLGTVLLAIAGPAYAADMHLKALPAPAPVFSWTGCYIGGHAGGASARQDLNVNPTTAGNQANSAFSLSKSSWIAGGQVGCNQQYGTVVVGVEGDWTSTHDLLNSSFAAPNLFASGLPVGSGGISVTTSGQWLASLRVRAGIAVVPTVLLYVTAGPAWQHTNYTVSDAFSGGCPNCSNSAFTVNAAGLAVGGGVEWSPMGNGILLRGEFLYYDLPGETQTLDGPGGIHPLFTQSDLKIAVARAGLSFKY